jgi:hypothetical protein
MPHNDSPNRRTSQSPFQIVCRMHPRGVYELMNLGRVEKISEDGEDFATTMQ